MGIFYGKVARISKEILKIASEGENIIIPAGQNWDLFGVMMEYRAVLNPMEWFSLRPDHSHVYKFHAGLMKPVFFEGCIGMEISPTIPFFENQVIDYRCSKGVIAAYLQLRITAIC